MNIDLTYIHNVIESLDNQQKLLKDFIEHFNNKNESYTETINELNETISKLKQENDELKSQLKDKEDELKNINKISLVQSLSKQLTNKDLQITQLQNQLEKLKPKETIVVKPIINEKDPIKETTIVKEQLFNPDNFEAPDGWSVIKYKKVHYLLHEETGRVFTILKNTYHKHIGNLKDGKMKLLK